MTASPSIPISWVAAVKRGAGTCGPFPESVAAAGPVTDCECRAGSGSLFLAGSGGRSGSRNHGERCRECPNDDEIEVLANCAYRYDSASPVDRRATAERRWCRLSDCPRIPQRPIGPETTLAGRTQAQSRCCRSRAVEQHGRPLHDRLDSVANLLPRLRRHAARRGEVLRPLRGAERARGLHAQLDHARVSLGPVVGEEHAGMVQEAQGLRIEVPQTQHRIVAGSRFLRSFWADCESRRTGTAFGRSRAVGVRQR